MERKFKVVLVLLVFAMAITVVPAGKSHADDMLEEGPVSLTFSNDDEKLSKEPGIEAAAAIVMEAGSGRVLYARNPTVKRSIASTTKIMTAILALENGNLNDSVKISSRAANIGGSTIGISEKQVYTLNELLYGMMLNSGNDAAVAIAEHIGGSVEGFAEMMNAKAREIGAADSVFVTPHGLDVDGQYSTAYDLAIITRYALKNDYFRRIVSTKKAVIPGHSFYNTNELLDIYPGADGVKTGYTGKAGRCLVTTAVHGDMRLISVVLGCSSRTKRAEGSRKILNYAFNNYRLYNLVEEGQNFGELPVLKGRTGTVAIGAGESVSLPLSQTEYEKLERKVFIQDSIIAPVYAGIDCGSISYRIDGVELAETSLKTWEEIERKNFGNYLQELVTIWCRLMREGVFMS